MASREEIILELRTELGESQERILGLIATLQELEERHREYREELNRGAMSQDEYDSRTESLNERMSIYRNSIDQLNTVNEERLHQISLQEGAISTYRQELKELTDEYERMSIFQRNSSEGEELLQSITSVTREVEVAQNQFERSRNELVNFEDQILSTIGMNDGFIGSLMNVARAGGGFRGVFSSMITSAANFGRALLALAANPVVLTLIAIVVAVKLIVEAFKKNEEATGKLNMITDKLNVVLAVLSSVFDLLLEAMKPVTDFIADTLVEVFDWAMDAIESMVSALAGFLSFLGFDGVADKLNKFNEKVKDSVKNSQELAKAEKELKKAEDELARSQKSRQREMEKLKAIQDDSSLSDKERIKAAEELGKKRKEGLLAELNAAEKALIVANLKLKTEGRTAEAMALQAEISDKIAAINDEIIKSDKDTQKSISSIRQEGAARAKEIREKELQETRALQDSQVAIMEEGLDKMRKETENSFNREIEDLTKRLNEETNLSVKAKEALKARIEIIEKQKNAALEKLSEENWKNEADKHLERLNKELSMIQENSQRAFDIKKEQLEKEREIALRYAEKNNISLEEVNAKFDAEAKKIEEEEQKNHIQILLSNERDAFTQRVKDIIAQGKTEAEARLQAKREEIAQMKQLENESDEDFKKRKEEALKEESALYATRLEQKKAEGLTENEAKLQLKQEELTNLETLEGISDEERMKRYLELKAEEQVIKDQIAEDEHNERVAKVQAHQAMFNEMSGILEEFGINSAALGAFSKALALYEIGLDTAKAITKGVASAQAVPFPGNIPAIVTTVGTIMANVANAKKLLSKEKAPEAPKFATGGLVTGEGSGTSDSITARLSSGESVITAMGTQMFGPMLSAFNQIGGGVPITATNTAQQAIGQEMLTEAFRKALDTMPAPVVAVSEINNVNKRVEVLESYGTL